MAGTRRVQVVGSDDPWEVLCETETTMILVNPAARDRREIGDLERQLEQARERLATRKRPALVDVNRNPITGP